VIGAKLSPSARWKKRSLEQREYVQDYPEFVGSLKIEEKISVFKNLTLQGSQEVLHLVTASLQSPQPLLFETKTTIDLFSTDIRKNCNLIISSR
jgi:hypothetical protein